MAFGGIRGRALLLAGLSILPMLGLVLFLSQQQRAQELRATARQAQVLANLIAAEQTRIIAQSRQLMTGLALSADGAGAELLGPSCGSRLSALLDAYRIYHQVFFALPDGEVRCAGRPLRRPVNIADRGYFRRALATRAFTLSGVIFDRDSRVYTIAAAQPLLGAGGRPVGVLVASVDLNWIGDTLSTAALPKNTLVSLVDRTGTILARFPASGAYVGRKIADFARFRTTVEEGRTDLREGTDGDGLERFVTYSKLPDLPGDLYLRVAIPAWVVEQAADRSLRQGLTGLALVLALTLLLAWIAAGRLVARPVERLTEAAERLGRGDLSARTGISGGRGEIARLAARFDELAAGLQHSQRARRTLSAGNRTLLREREEASLLREMCRVAVEHGGYPLAFVCYARDDAAKSVEVVAQHGADDGLLDSLAMTWADSERGRGSVGSAIRSGRTAFLRHIASDPAAAPWRDDILKRGFGSVVSLPLKAEGRVIGTFTLYASEPDAFDLDEVELLDEMAADLSHGIAGIRESASRREAEAQAEFVKTHDLVTGLPNRGAFLLRIGNAIAEAAPAGAPLAVLVLHPPRIQEIYDGLGYDPGNAVLREIARRVRLVVGDDNNVAALPTDEIGVLLPHGGTEAAAALGRRLGEALRAPVDVDQVRIEIPVSIGMSRCPDHGGDPALLLRRAKLAAREAARRELAVYAYEGPTERENPARLALASELRGAIEQRQLLLHFQRKIALASGADCGGEALVRWQHPSKGLVPPMQFIPVAEETGLVKPMTYLLIESVVRQLQAWAQAGRRVPIAVNLSARNIRDTGLVHRIEDLLGSAKLAPELLEFEVTESALVDDPRLAREVLLAIRRLGCKLYIDDFGTGYSSLSYLVSLPVQALKVDRSFVKEMRNSAQARQVVESVISMAHSLGLQVVAEGVETEQDAAILRELRCDEAQGYLYGKPLPAQEFAAGLAGG